MSEKINIEIRQILFTIIYKAPASLAPSTLLGYYYIVKRVSKFALAEGVCLKQLLFEKSLLIKLNEFLRGKKLWLKLFNTLVNTLIKVGHKNTGFKILNNNEFNSVFTSYPVISKYHNQHPVVPQSIYINLIKETEKFINDFNGYKHELKRFICLRQGGLTYARSLSGQSQNLNAKGISARSSVKEPTFHEAIDENNLSELCIKYDLTTWTKVVRFLSQVQQACKVLVHTYTGMRHSEAALLPFDCLAKKYLDDRVVYIVKGNTSKLSKSIKPASWITSIECVRAIDAANCVAKIISAACDLKISQDNQTPLFLSTSYLFRVNKKPESNSGYYMLAINNFIKNSYIDYFKSSLIITSKHVDELKKIEPHSNWRENPKFKIGTVWPLTTHQLRRSLAVYAANSGHVTLPSLKNLLKHISEEMTLYYSRNCTFAKSFVGAGNNLPHISDEYKSEVNFAKATQYLKEVIDSNGRLFGGHGSMIQKQKDNHNGYQVFNNIESTLKKVKDGEISYKATAFGGCTKVDYCNKGRFITIAECINCNHSVFSFKSLPKLEKAISLLKIELEDYDEKSFEHDSIQSQVFDLEKMVKRIENSI